ncbi:UNVERIFIED_CONTAM: hypothetical protein RMT77_017847 [Armadillidium vulgare]
MEENILQNETSQVTENNLIKYLLLRLLCCERNKNVQNFRLVMEKNERKKFDDFAFMFDTDKGKTKYVLMRLLNLDVEGNYSCIGDFINLIDLSHDVDHYLLSDGKAKHFKLEELIIFTNVEIKNFFVLLKRKKWKSTISKRLLGRNVNLYKLKLDDLKSIHKIFQEQFLSQGKRLANELAKNVMLKRPIDVRTIMKNDSFSLIQTFYLMLLEHVIDEENNQFKKSFLYLNEMNETERIDKDSLKHKKSEEMKIKKFRKDFIKSVVEFCQTYERKTVDELLKTFNFGSSHEEIERVKELQQDLMSFPRDEKEITNFLRSRKNILIEIPEEEIIQSIAKELVLSVMLHKSFDISSLIPSQMMLSKFKKILKENVFEYNSKKLKETFLNDNSDDSEQIVNIRKCFYSDLKKFHDLCKDKDIKELDKLINLYCSSLPVDQTSAVSLHEALKLYENNEKGFAEFLLNKEIRFKKSFNKTKISSYSFPSEDVDNVTVFEEILIFLNLITFAVIQYDTNILVSREIKAISCNKENAISISEGFNEFVDNWILEEGSLLLQDFDSNLKHKMSITKQNLVNSLCIFYKSMLVKFSDICSQCELIPPRSLLNIFNKDKIPSLGRVINSQHASIYVPRTLTQSRKVDADVFFTFSKDIIILTVGQKFNVTDFNMKYSLTLKFKNMKSFNENDSYFYTTKRFNHNFLREFYNKNKEIVGNRRIHWITYLGSDLRYESSYVDLNKYKRQSNRANEFFIYPSHGIKWKKKKYFTENEVIQQERFIIITGDPGIGKTVLLNHVLHSLDSGKPPLYWLIMISLSECQKYLDKYSNLRVTKNAIKFLSDCENSAGEFSRSVLNYFLNESRLIIFFDGFEDLHSSKNRQKLKDLLKFLKSSNVKQVWISTTPPYSKELENILGVISFGIEGLSKAEQINLVADLWKMSYDDTSENDDFLSKSKKLIETFNNSFENEEGNLLATPLYLHMLAIAVKDEAKCETSFNCEEINLDQLCKSLKKYKNESSNRKDSDVMKLQNVGMKKTNKFLKNVDKYLKSETFKLEWAQIIQCKEQKMLRKKIKKMSKNINYYEDKVFFNWNFEISGSEKYKMIKSKIRLEKMSRNVIYYKKESFVRKDAKETKLQNENATETNELIMNINKHEEVITPFFNEFQEFATFLNKKKKIKDKVYKEKRIKKTLKGKKEIKRKLTQMTGNRNKIEVSLSEWAKSDKVNKHEEKLKLLVNVNEIENYISGQDKVIDRTDLERFNTAFPLLNEAHTSEIPNNRRWPKVTFKRQKKKKMKPIYSLSIERGNINF